MSSNKNYPECEKLAKVRDKSQAIGEFLEWLRGGKSFELCRWNKDDKLIVMHDSIEELLAEFFNIDLKKAEKERQQMIDDIRKAG